jgi:peptidyl-prolyl cis-trans isomerase SurA
VNRLLVALLVTALPTVAVAGKVVERVVAVINEDIILETEVEQATVPHLRGAPDMESNEGKKAWEAVKRKALDDLIESRLVMQQAAELKLSVQSEEVDRAIEEVKKQNKLDDATFVEALKQQGFTMEGYRKNLRRQILGLKVINTAVRSRVSVSDDEVKTYYNQNTRQLEGQTNAHLRQVLVSVPTDAPAAEADRRKKVALKVVELARAGKSFVELAKAYSDDEMTKADGGDLGWVGPGVLQDALEQEVAGMVKGDVRGPVRTARGWHVLQLVERQAAAVRPLEEVKDQIRKQLYDQQVEKATQAWIKELRKKAHVDIRL